MHRPRRQREGQRTESGSECAWIFLWTHTPPKRWTPGQLDMLDTRQILVRRASACKTGAVVTYTARVVRDVDTAEPDSCPTVAAPAGVWALFIVAHRCDDVAELRACSRSRAIEHHATSSSTSGGWPGCITRWRRRRRTCSTPTSSIPERHVLAYSDAMLVEGLIAAPMFAAGMRPMLIHNLLLLGAIAASGIGMYHAGALSLAERRRRDHRRPGVCLRALPLRPLHAHGAAMDDVDPVGVLGDAAHARYRQAEVRPADRRVHRPADLSSIYYGIFLVILLSVAGDRAARARGPAARG